MMHAKMIQLMNQVIFCFDLGYTKILRGIRYKLFYVSNNFKWMYKRFIYNLF